MTTYRTLLTAALALALPTGLAAQGIVITSPPKGQPAYGTVELAAEVQTPNPLRHVEFYVDGVPVGTLTDPPFRMEYDVGQANIAHHVRAVARDLFGTEMEATVSTGVIAVDEEVDVDLLQLFVSVTDNRGHRVTDLAEDEFTVLDDRGRRETIATFGGGDLPISAVLLVDSSESMEGRRLEAALAGARAFIGHTREGDETMVALFSDRLLRTTSFTNDSGMFDQTLAGVRAAGGTSVNDHIYYAINRLESRLGRRVIVLLSDGYDISSVLDMEQVQWRARRSQAMIYWIRLEDQVEGGIEPPQFNSNWRDASGNERQFRLITEAVAESGGRILSIADLSRLEGAFRSIVEELREQYVLGYHPSNRRHDGSWRQIRVRTSRYGLDVRARAGYID